MDTDRRDDCGKSRKRSTREHAKTPRNNIAVHLGRADRELVCDLLYEGTTTQHEIERRLRERGTEISLHGSSFKAYRTWPEYTEYVAARKQAENGARRAKNILRACEDILQRPVRLMADGRLLILGEGDRVVMEIEDVEALWQGDRDEQAAGNEARGGQPT